MDKSTRSRFIVLVTLNGLIIIGLLILTWLLTIRAGANLMDLLVGEKEISDFGDSISWDTGYVLAARIGLVALVTYGIDVLVGLLVWLWYKPRPKEMRFNWVIALLYFLTVLRALSIITILYLLGTISDYSI